MIPTELTSRVERCRSADCRADIVWTRTEHGKAMPVDAEPHPEGTVALAVTAGRVMARVSVGQQLAADRRGGQMHRSHFATCTKAAAFRRLR